MSRGCWLRGQLGRRVVGCKVGRRVLLAEGEGFLAVAAHPPRGVLFLDEHLSSLLSLATLGGCRPLGPDQAPVQHALLHRLHALFPSEKGVLRLAAVPDERPRDLVYCLSAAVALLKVTDILIYQFWLFIFLISILEHLSVLTDLDIQFFVIISTLISGGRQILNVIRSIIFSCKLNIDMS